MRGFKMRSSKGRSRVAARATPYVPPAWPGRAEAPPDFKPRTTPKVRAERFVSSIISPSNEQFQRYAYGAAYARESCACLHASLHAT